MIIYVWTFTALVGALIAGWNTIDSYLDLRALGGLINGRRILALGWVRREALRFLMQATWAVLGFLSLQYADSPVSPIIIALTATNVALAVSTILDARDRLALRRMLALGRRADD